MITKETRQLSFEDIKPKRQERYNLILEHLDRPKTVMELTKEIFNSDNRNLVAPRLTELTALGKVKVINKVKCGWTGKQVALYQKVEDVKKLVNENVDHIPRLN